LERVSNLRVPRESPDETADVEVATQSDPRWQLTQRIVVSRHFARSPLLSRFLLYVVGKTIEGQEDGITEHQIGVQVFGRPHSYRTVEDNIVRNYARQLRKRLAEHFAEDRESSLRIEIPVGGYVPVFKTNERAGTRAAVLAESSPHPFELHPLTEPAAVPAARKPFWLRNRWYAAAAFLAYSALLVCTTWIVAGRMQGLRESSYPTSALWKVLLNGSATTYIVPPDAGLNLVEDLSHHQLPLAEYLQGGYMNLPLGELDKHSADDLRLHQFTDFVNLQIVAALSRLAEFNPERVLLRFPRDLRLDDLKNSNALIIGSVCSNPWAATGGDHANFTIVCSQGMEGSAIVNRHPQSGEQLSYVSHWNEPTHETYALVAFLPNLSGKGHMLFLEGLDVAGTQAASEAVLRTGVIEPILRQATRPDGSLASFEVLLKSTSIESNATDTQIIASRIH
jgi:hypothetical protein